MRAVLLIVAIFAIAWLALGQAPGAGQAPTRIGVVDRDGILTQTAEGKAVQTDLERKFEPKQKELQARVAEFQKLQAEFQQKQASMNELDRQKRVFELQQRQKELERMNEDLTGEFNAAREDVLRRLLQRLADVVQKYGAAHQFAAIFDIDQAGALYVAPGVDLNQEIIKAYDAAYPVKPAGQ